MADEKGTVPLGVARRIAEETLKADHEALEANKPTQDKAADKGGKK